MAKKSRSLHLPLSPPDAYSLVHQAGSEIPKFKLKVQDMQQGLIQFYKGWGLTNPIDVTIRLEIHPDHTTTAHLEAGILALADPLGFLNGTLDQFEGHIKNHVQARQTGQPVAPLKKDTRPLYVNLAVFGCAGVLVVGCIVAGIVIALMGK